MPSVSCKIEMSGEAAPDEPLRLVKPEAYYKYVDPQLEALPAGQKILVRLGNSNAARVKAKLREFRAALLAASED